ncbi:MAG: hypothetical protein KIT18_15770 [Burkholderiales bacterium]|nr:hypothetical protein [Burkholderiales bacterium]
MIERALTARECRAIGCARKTRAESGFCFQHAEMFPLMAANAARAARMCADCGIEEVHHARRCYGCWKEARRDAE